MGIEVPIFRSQEGLRHIGRQRTEADRGPMSKAPLTDHLSISIEKGDAGGPVHRPKGLLPRNRWKFGKRNAPDPEPDQQGGQCPGHQPSGQPTEQLSPADLGLKGKVGTDHACG